MTFILICNNNDFHVQICRTNTSTCFMDFTPPPPAFPVKRPRIETCSPVHHEGVFIGNNSFGGDFKSSDIMRERFGTYSKQSIRVVSCTCWLKNIVAAQLAKADKDNFDVFGKTKGQTCV